MNISGRTLESRIYSTFFLRFAWLDFLNQILFPCKVQLSFDQKAPSQLLLPEFLSSSRFSSCALFFISPYPRALNSGRATYSKSFRA
jgi:hypothetical protein